MQQPDQESKFSVYRGRFDWPSLFVFFLPLTLFLSFNANFEFIGFQSRFALFAQEMMRNGLSFFPTTYNEPYPDYSAFSTLLIWLCSLPLGKVTYTSAILPTALISSLIVLLTYRLAKLFDTRWGLASAACLLITVAFFEQARDLSLDQGVSLATLGVFYVLIASQYNGQAPSRIALLALLCLGFAFRGPIGLVIPTGVAVIFYVLDGRWREAIGFGFAAFGLLVLLTITLLALAAAEGGPDFVNEVLRMQVLSRLGSGESEDPFYAYLTRAFGSYAFAYPLAFLVACFGSGEWLRINAYRRPGNLILKSIGAILIIILGLSFSSRKPTHYILSIAPFCAIVAGFLFTELAQDKWLQRIRRVVGGFFRILPLLCVVLLHFGQQNSVLQLYLTTATTTVLIITFIIIQLLAEVLRAWRICSPDSTALMAAIASFSLIQLLIVAPMKQQINASATFVRQVEAQRLVEDAPLAFYQIGQDALAIKWLVQLDQPIAVEFDNDPAIFNYADDRTYFVAREETYEALPTSIKNFTNIRFSGNVGRKDIVVFQHHE